MDKYRLPENERLRIERHFQCCSADAPVQVRVHHPDYPCIPGSRRDQYGVYSFLKKDGTLRFHLGDPRKSGLSESCYYSINSICPTITCSWMPKLWDLQRTLSPRECLRLMGFDDNFRIVVSDDQMYRQAGNSIVVNTLEAIFGQVPWERILEE